MIAAPDGEADTHLEALSKLSTLLMNPGFKDALIAAKTKEEFLKIIDDTESERYEKEEKKESQEVKAEEKRPKKDTACWRLPLVLLELLIHLWRLKPGKYGEEAGNCAEGGDQWFRWGSECAD